MRRSDDQESVLYDVTYRGTGAGGRQAEIRLRTSFAAATLADAWTRFIELEVEVDPRTIEIELRRLETTSSA